MEDPSTSNFLLYYFPTSGIRQYYVRADYASHSPSQQTLGYFEGLYRKYNPYVLIAHSINLIAILVCYFVKFRHIPDSYVFVSPVAKLHWTQYALLTANNQSENRCDLATTHSPSPQQLYPDFMPHVFYDFTDTYLVQYDHKESINIHIIWAIFSFFLLSLCFQAAHYYQLRSHSSMPRILHYIEYAFSSTLMIMVMAINTGILDLVAIVELCAVFFGMNMLGGSAEVMSHYVGYIPIALQPTFTRMIWLFHRAGWLLFLFAIVPIWIQLHNAIHCSDGGSPGFLIAAVVMESFCFFLFGFLQVASLRAKILSARPNFLPDSELLFKYDCFHALLSLLAKTLLAWLLLAPAASVIT
jgi:hypothetical protein